MRLQPCTWIDLELPPDIPVGAVRGRIVADAVTDPLLREFDRNPHNPVFNGDSDLHFASGTELEFTVERAGKAGAPQRIVVGTTSRQAVVLR